MSTDIIVGLLKAIKDFIDRFIDKVVKLEVISNDICQHS